MVSVAFSICKGVKSGFEEEEEVLVDNGINVKKLRVWSLEERRLLALAEAVAEEEEEELEADVLETGLLRGG